MNKLTGVHPTDDLLASYGLGKADEKTAAAVALHLESCEKCRSRVANLSSDSFVGRLRSLKASASTSNSGHSMPTLNHGLSDDAGAHPIPNELLACKQYEAIRELGQGGMGVVYVARNKLMGREEVLKVVSRTFLERPGAVDRFLREIQSAARLQHPNVVAAYSALQLGNLLVFAMEYVPGEDLSEVVRTSGRPVPVPNACYYVLQAALGLQHAHEKGMVHRDIKPSNLILTREGTKSVVKILDFGLAKVGSEKTIDTRLTLEGGMLGTPDFMAPEQALDASQADIRADIYSLGCTLYYLLAGRPPFAANSVLELLQHHQGTPAPSIRLIRTDVPEELSAVVARMMAKDPRMRFQTPGEVAKVLSRFVKRGAAAKAGQQASLSTVNDAANKTSTERPVEPKKSHSSLVVNLFPVLPAAFGRYRILRLLGHGGMGAVYLADDSQLGRQVALKIPFFTTEDSPQRVERFVREAKSAAALHHPNICTVFDAGEVGGKPFITMAYLAGTPLDQQLDGDVRTPQRRAAEIARKIALALDHAHGKGTVHRDLKPANVMIAPDGEPVVMDFGLAKRASHAEEGEGKLTRKGAVIGTPGYMSPEQVRGDSEATGPTTDVYSLGVILFEMLTSRTPYQGSIVQVMGQILAAPVPTVREFRPDVDPRLDAVCQRAMAKNPRDRFPSMGEFAHALNDVLTSSTSQVAAEREIEVELVLPAEPRVTPIAASTAKAPPAPDSPFEGLDAPAPPPRDKKKTVRHESKERVEKETRPDRTPPRNRWKLTAAVAAAFLAVATALAAVVLRLETPEGVLLVEINDPSLEVKVKDGKLILSDPDGKLRYILSPAERNKKVAVGDYKIRVEGADGVALDTDEFTLKKNGTVIVRVIPAPVPVAKLPQKDEPQPASTATKTVPSPAKELEALRREAIPREALAYAGGGDPERAPASLVCVLGEAEPIQTDAVLGLAYSPDSRWLASGSLDKTIFIRDATTLNVKHILKGHSGGVSAVAYSKDGKTLASAARDGTVRLWSTATFTELRVLNPEIGDIQAMAISPDGRHLAVGNRDHPIKLWHWGEWDKQVELDGQKGHLTALTFSPNGETLASSWEGVVRIYKTADGKPTQTWPFNLSTRRLVFHPDGKRLLTTGEFIEAWDVATAQRVTRSRGDAARCDLIALHPDGETLYVVFEGGVWSYNLRVEDLLPFSGGKRAHFYRAPHGISAVAFSPDGRYLAQGIFSGNVLVRDYSKVTSDPLVREPSPRADKHLPSPGHTHYVKVVAVGPDGKALSGGDDNVIRRWDVARPADGKASGSIEWVLDDLAVSPNGKKYVTTESSEGATGCARNVWSASTGQRLVAADKTVYADRSTFSPDGKLIAGCGRGTDTVVLYDAETGQQVHKFPAVGVSRDRPTFSRDGKLLAVATFETKRVVVWTVRTGEEFASWTDDRPMTAVAFRPDGKWIATGGEAGAISLWEVGTATKKRVWEGHAGAITRLAFTPDGRALVSSGVDGTIRVWAPEQPRAVEVIPLGPPSKPITFDLDPSGKYLFAAGQTPLVFIVRLPDLREPADASSPSPPIPGGDESQKADSDPFRAGSVWVGAEGDKQMTLTVTERTGAFFKARLIAGDEVDRVLSGTVGGGKVKWAAKDVQGLKGGRGLDNEGVFGRDENGTDRLDFTYRPTGAAQPAGAFVLRIKTTRSEPLDPDRAAAVFVLSSGGGVRVNNEERTIRAVADLPPNAFRLTWVDFHSGNVTDKDFQVFAGCQELTFMQLRCPKLGDAGLSYFKGCKKLQNLELYHTQVTDDGLAVFAGCTHLKVLILNDCRRVGNAGMAQFKNCGELTKLEIPHTQVTDQGLTWFKDFKNFYEIRMENTHVGGDGLTAFKNSPVRFLWLTDCKKIDDAALVLLKQFKLEAVLLRGTSVTAAGVAALRASLPNCKVDWVEPKKPIGPAVEPNTNLDPDRAAAEYVISIGGTIRINGSERGLEDPVPDRNTFPWQPRSPDANRDINLAAKLPAEAFELTWVELRDNKRADDQVLEKLKGCKSLLYLGLQGTTVTDAGVKNLGECKNLRQVNLCLTGIGDSGLEGLKPCTKITALGLGDTQVTDKGLSLFKGSECLTHICLQNTKVTDVGVSHLTAAKSLESIDLNRTAVSDKGVWFLRGCKDLRMAALVFTQVTKRGLDELKSTFPECRIITR